MSDITKEAIIDAIKDEIVAGAVLRAMEDNCGQKQFAAEDLEISVQELDLLIDHYNVVIS
jgi:hypothetical protein